MKWFGFKSGRDGARPPLSRGASAYLSGVPGYWPRGYDAQVREGYLANPIAQRAVKLVAEGVGSAPLAVSDPALAALIGARTNGQALTEVITAQLLLHGNAYVQIMADEAGAPVELFALRPERVAPARWRLSRLWRGRRGTEAAIGTQRTGDRFVMIESDALTPVDLPLSALGATARVMASGIGDTGGPVLTEAMVSGVSVTAPSPVDVQVSEVGDGNAAVTWVRRSRLGWRWTDGAEVPLAEEREAYHVTVTPAAGAPRTIETPDPAMTVTAADRAAGPVSVTIRQAGSYGESPATVVTVCA